jgi:hypothetical protein
MLGNPTISTKKSKNWEGMHQMNEVAQFILSTNAKNRVCQ